MSFKMGPFSNLQVKIIEVAPPPPGGITNMGRPGLISRLSGWLSVQQSLTGGLLGQRTFQNV